MLVREKIIVNHIEWSEAWNSFEADFVVEKNGIEYSMTLKGETKCVITYHQGDEVTPEMYERSAEQIIWNASFSDENGIVQLDYAEQEIEEIIDQYLK